MARRRAHSRTRCAAHALPANRRFRELNVWNAAIRPSKPPSGRQFLPIHRTIASRFRLHHFVNFWFGRPDVCLSRS